jgi:hypothetical protein
LVLGAKSLPVPLKSFDCLTRGVAHAAVPENTQFTFAVTVACTYAPGASAFVLVPARNCTTLLAAPHVKPSPTQTDQPEPADAGVSDAFASVHPAGAGMFAEPSVCWLFESFWMVSVNDAVEPLGGPFGTTAASKYFVDGAADADPIATRASNNTANVAV